MKRSSMGALFLLASACSSSMSSLETRDPEETVRRYEAALDRHPGDIELRMALERARAEASLVHRRRARELEKASDLSGAARELELALSYDGTSPYLEDWLEEVRQRLEEPPADPALSETGERPFTGEPVLDPASDALIHLSFAEETSLRTILETLAELAGVNILFDESFRDRRVSVELKGVTFEEALELLLETHGLFYKVVHSRAVQVSPHR